MMLPTVRIPAMLGYVSVKERAPPASSTYVVRPESAKYATMIIAARVRV